MSNWLKDVIATGWGSAPYCFWLFSAAFILFYPLEKRKGWTGRTMGCLLLFMAFGFLLPPERFGDVPALACLWYIVAWFLICLQCQFICRISWTEAFYCGINAVLVEHIGSAAQILLTTRLFHGQMQGLRSYSMAAYVVVYLVIWLTVGRKLVSGQNHLRVNRLSVTLITITGLMVTVVLSMLLKSNIDPELAFELADPHAVSLLEVGQWYAIFFCGSILTLEYEQQRELVSREKLAMSHEMWSVRQKQYEMSRETIESINRKCHDMKHQIAALMATGSDSKEKREYSQEVERLVEVYDLQVNTENEALNTILMEKGLYCSTHGIRWNCAVDDTALEFIQPMDLYVLLGNALDNAVEAVNQLESSSGRIIQLRISRKDRFVGIRIENSYAGALNWEGDLPVTTKLDKSSHGIGLKSVRDIAARYGGSVTAVAEGQAFILSIVIPIPAAGK